ncbi:MAG: glycosyltransferase family 4 protein [Candidatus Odinarchaeota archaeon]
MKRICFVCPTTIMKRSIAAIIKKLKNMDVSLILPKVLAKEVDNSVHYSIVKNAKTKSFNVILPHVLLSQFSIPINPLFFIKILKKNDIIHMWVPFYISNSLLALFKRLFFPNKKIILTMDTIPGYSFRLNRILDIFFRGYYKTIGRIVFGSVDLITLYGKSMLKYARMAGVPLNKICITPTGIDSELKIKDNDIRKEFDISKDDRIILYIGYVNPRKGIDTIIEIVNLLKFNDEKIKCIIVGDGPNRKNYEKQVKKKKLNDKIIFTGFRKDVHNFYIEADLFLFPSRGEGLAGVIMESMIYGVPIIASKIPGNMDLIKDKENGFLCEMENPKDYKDKIITLLKDSNLQKKFINKSREIIKDKFSWDKNIKEFLKLYK